MSQVPIAEAIQRAPQQGSISFHLRFFPLAFMFLACKPIVEINGQPAPLSWGRHRFEFPPGSYEAKVYFHYLWLPRCGENQVLIDLAPDEDRHVSFYMWPWVFARGSMNVT